MGLFDFFKSKNTTGNINQAKKTSIAPDAQNGFDLKLADFDTKTHSAQVISVTYSPDFYELFPEAKKAANTGNKLELRTSTVKISLWGQPVEVTFNPDTVAGSPEEFINQMNGQLNWLIKNKDRVEDVIIRDLLPLKNENWLDEEEDALSREEFLQAISPDSVDFDEETGFTLRYHDGDLFSGHGIAVEISAKRKVEEASVEG